MDFGPTAISSSRSTNASTGRAMFFRLSGPSSSNTRLSRSCTWSRTDRDDADAARRTFGLNSRRHIHRVAVQVSPIGNRVANVDPDAEADGSIRRLIPIVDRNLLLHLHGAPHRPVDAVEHDEQRVAASLDDPATMLLDRWVYQLSAQRPQPLRVPASSSPIRRL